MLSETKFKDDFIGRLFDATTAVAQCLEQNKEMRSLIDMVEAQIGLGGRPRVLIITATNVERDTVLETATAMTGVPPKPKFGARRGYFDLGEIGGASVFMVQCEMGSVGPGASLSSVSDALDEIQPCAAIMVGIAFGVDEKKQDIGDVIVSKQLQMYELSRVGTHVDGTKHIIFRGDKVTASTLILSRIRIAEVNWTGSKIRYGVMLTGEKLIDNIDYRDELASIGGDTEGGEMEGAGLYAAAADRKIDWIVVKGICDWADGNKGKNKSKRQLKAAQQAISFVFRALQQGGFSTLDPSGRAIIR